MPNSGSAGAGHEREWQLLLLCARTKPDSGALSQIHALVAGQLDWDYLIETAHHHRVLPLLHRHLARLDAAAMPSTAMQRLRAAFETNIRRNLFLTRELLQLLDLFAANDIPVIPYKGPVLASLLHGDPGLRQFSDLDVLVPVEKVPSARTLLMSRGYRPDVDMTDRQLRAFIRREKDITLLRDDVGIDLEIHWRITADHDPVRVSPDFVWQHVRTCQFAGRSVQVLTPEALLLVLCIHGARHRWEKLTWLCDIAAIIRSPVAVNWNRVIDDAIALRCERILALGIVLAEELLDAELPERARALIRADRGLTTLALEVKQHLFSNSSLAPDLGEPERFFLRLRTRGTDRLRIALSQVRRYAEPTSRDEETVPVPGSLRWALYLTRPVRLAWEYGFTPVRRLWRGLFHL